MAKNETEVLSERIAQLEAQLAQKSDTSPVTELAKAIIANQPKDPAMAGFTEEQIKAHHRPLTAHRFRTIRCKSEDTGSTFDAVVVESANPTKFPHGRIVRIEKYKHPANLYAYVDQGGLIPAGMPVVHDKPGMPPMTADGEPIGILHAAFKQWRWEEFWLRDLKKYNGRAMRAEFCAEDGGMKAEWQTSSTNAIIDPADMGE